MGILGAFMVPHPPLIIPEVGRGEEKGIQNTIDAYREVARRIGRRRPETIVLISPHQLMYQDYFHISPGRAAEGDMGQFRAENVKFRVTYDTILREEICAQADKSGIPAGTRGERDKRLDHGTMVPLYFVNEFLPSYELVRIGLSGLSLDTHYELGRCIREAVERLDKRVVLIASGDLSHRLKEDGPYGYRKEGPEYDQRIMEVMGKGNFSELLKFPEDFCDRAGECGHRSFTIMAGALDGLQVQPQRLSYEGPFGVGYGICAYEVGEDAYVRLARRTIEEYIRTGKIIRVPEGLLQEMYSRRAGVFVSLKKAGNLRGCIGTVQGACPSIAEEIIHNAVSASTRDPRFPPVREEELDQLSISVDVLGETEKIYSPKELDVRRYGVIVTRGYRRGLLLPNLEGVDTVEEQISIARQKAGIGWDEPVELERFEVIRHF